MLLSISFASSADLTRMHCNARTKVGLQFASDMCMSHYSLRSFDERMLDISAQARHYNGT